MRLLMLLLFVNIPNGLWAGPATPNYSSYINYSTNGRNPKNNRTLTRSRKIDVFDPQQQKPCTDKFCTDVSDYPKDYIQSLNLEKFEHLFVDDFVDTLALRFDGDELGLCQSRKRLIHPKKGVTAQGSWLTIINNDDNKYRQGILIEECINQYYPCDYSQNFPLSVESKCKQSYIYRSLLAINTDGRPVMEHFQFPSCCKCVVTIGHRSNTNRFGDDNNERQNKNTDPPYIFPN